MKEATQKNLQQVQILSDNLKRFQHNLGKAKKKYQKSFLELDEAKANYKNSDGGQAIVKRK